MFTVEATRTVNVAASWRYTCSARTGSPNIRASMRNSRVGRPKNVYCTDCAGIGAPGLRYMVASRTTRMFCGRGRPTAPERST